MASNNIFEEFETEDIYMFKRWGSFGRFSTINNFPIEFFVTTIKSSQLSSLTFARDIKPSSIDFEQLLQRDIDEERVRSEISPYLTSPQLTEAEIGTKTIFFPPLLVAAVPVTNKRMESHYSSQKIIKESKMIVREWDSLFRISLRVDNNGYTFKPTAISNEVISVSREPAHIEINLSNGVERGIKLVVIDGQHRLKALMNVYADNPAILSELAVPICILFSPNSTFEVAEKLKENEFKVPTIAEIFRQLFVDVNKNAVQVGGHFNILLSEGNVGSIICRDLCSSVLDARGAKALAQIEWNQKNKKLSTEITKKYFVTSIGVIEKSLSETFGKAKLPFNYMVQFDEIKDLVHPDDDDDHIEYPKVTWDRFSLSQKQYIKNQVHSYVTPMIDWIFFESNLYDPATNCFNKKLAELESKTKQNAHGETHFQPVLDYILEYTPISDGVSMREARFNLRTFEEEVGICKDGQCFPLLNHAIFQRSIFLTWFEILKIGRQSGVNLNCANSVFKMLINEISSDLSNIISPLREYCQSFIFYSNKINPSNDTRIGMSCLMLGYLASKDKLDIVIKNSGADCSSLDRNHSSFIENVTNHAYYSINKFMELYSKNRMKQFKASYITDKSLALEQREELQLAENQRKRDERDYKEGKISKDKISNDFEHLVNNYIEKDMKVAMKELSLLLSLKLDVFGLTELSASSDYLDSEYDAEFESEV